MTALAETIVGAIRRVLGAGEYPLHEPRFAGSESEYVRECIKSTFVSSSGRFVERFEHELVSYTGAQYAVAVVNGTAALHVVLRLAGVEPDDEVVVPALTFVATANAVRYCGAIPHFADSEERTLGLDPASLRDWLGQCTDMCSGECVNRRTGRRIRALVAMHVFGHPCDVEGLLAIAHDFGLVLVEDAAESLGSTYQGRHTGTFGRLGILSFNGNKIITTGGGGALLTNDEQLARHARHLVTTAKRPDRWAHFHDELGYNYRLPNLNAALGCGQLEQLSAFVASKRRLYEGYRAAFDGIDNVRLFAEPTGSRSNYWLQTLILDEEVSDGQTGILEATNAAGYMSRPVWTPMHRLPPYGNCPRSPLPIAESLESRIINLPSSAGLR